jgi:uncharacterized membrane protein YkoI
MTINRSQASKRLFKKLSALRATLSNEERAILDSMIVVEVEAHKSKARPVARKTFQEVEAHQMKTKPVAKPAARKTFQEVEAHQMKTKPVAKPAARKTFQEVEAHQMKTKPVAKPAARNTPKEAESRKPAFRIAFDPNSEEYKVQE